MNKFKDFLVEKYLQNRARGRGVGVLHFTYSRLLGILWICREPHARTFLALSTMS